MNAHTARPLAPHLKRGVWSMMSYFVGDGDRAKLDLPRRGWKNKMQVKGMSRISVCEGVRRKKVVQEVSSSGSSSDNRAGRGPWTMSKKPDILALHKQVTSRSIAGGQAGTTSTGSHSLNRFAVRTLTGSPSLASPLAGALLSPARFPVLSLAHHGIT